MARLLYTIVLDYIDIASSIKNGSKSYIHILIKMAAILLFTLFISTCMCTRWT